MAPWQLNIHMQKINLSPSTNNLSQLTQNEPKMKMQNLKVNFLKENRGVNLADVGLGIS